MDVIQVLTANDYQTARKYWKVLKGRILQEAGQPVTICYQFKLRAADGKMRLSDVADQEQLFRIRAGDKTYRRINTSQYIAIDNHRLLWAVVFLLPLNSNSSSLASVH